MPKSGPVKQLLSFSTLWSEEGQRQGFCGSDAGVVGDHKALRPHNGLSCAMQPAVGTPPSTRST